jgi:predicted DNA-binding transcriptional regulator AlpA
MLIKIDPLSSYPQVDLAKALGKSERQLRRIRRNRRARFPRPFFVGRTPCWRGSAIIAWVERMQLEAVA